MTSAPPPPRLPEPLFEICAARWTWMAWGAYAALVVVGTWLLGPERQSVVQHYRTAALAWLAGEPMYSGHEHGFLYLPSFAVGYVPFALLPLTWGGALWRLLNLVTLAYGLWRMAGVGAPARRGLFFAVASACVLPLAYSSARHGQSTLAMGGAMLWAASELAGGRPWRAGLVGALGLVSKPLIVPFLLLAAATHRRMILPLLLAVAAALALPWLAQAPGYVAQQHADCLRMFRLAGDPTDLLRYPDLFGALRSLGYDVAPTIALGLRALAALLTLGVALRLTARGPTPWTAAGLYVLAASYVLLFNPRTEHNTYSLLGPALGLCAGFAWVGVRGGRALIFILLGVAMAQDRDLLRPLVGQQALWGKPLATLVFLVLAAREWSAARGAAAAQPGAAASTTRSA